MKQYGWAPYANGFVAGVVAAATDTPLWATLVVGSVGFVLGRLRGEAAPLGKSDRG